MLGAQTCLLLEAVSFLFLLVVAWARLMATSDVVSVPNNSI